MAAVCRGEIFTLTTDYPCCPQGVDQITCRFSTDGDDTFRALNPESFGSEDVLDGAGGFDVLDVDSISVGIPAPVIEGVERINNLVANPALNLSAVSGLEQLWSSANAIYTNASLSTIFGADGDGGLISVDFADDLSGDSDVFQIALEDNDGFLAEFIGPDLGGGVRICR